MSYKTLSKIVVLALALTFILIIPVMAQDEPASDLSTSTKVVEDASGDGKAQAGEILNFTITITNTGDLGAAVLLIDALPAGLTYVEGSLAWPNGTLGVFEATFEDNVLTAQTFDFGTLMPPEIPEGGSLSFRPPSNVVVLTFDARVSNNPPSGGQFSNQIELQDQYTSYDIAPAVIPIEYQLFMPHALKGYVAP